MLDDVELFLRVNEEYASKPLVPAPTKYDPESMAKLGQRRATELDQRNNLRGKRVLEFGCGWGETAAALATQFDCRVVAVDVNPGLCSKWQAHASSNVDFRILDLSQDDTTDLGQFDFIYSNGTLEHVVHPFAMLKKLTQLIPDGGRIHLNMGLHRGSIGSHLYREVYFPWPHLVFTESTFERFYERIGQAPRRPVWINHLTCAQYFEMFDRLGLHVTWTRHHDRALDEDFYHRFEDILNRYPRSDLQRDLMYVDLVKPYDRDLLTLSDVAHPAGKPLTHRRVEALQKEVERCEHIANARLQELKQQAAKIEQLELSQVASVAIRNLAAELQQKVARLEVIEERFNKDLRGVRQVGRAVNLTGSLVRALVEPQVGAVRSVLLGRAGGQRDAPKASRNGGT
jgi:trans-aconitate methyltransferase